MTRYLTAFFAVCISIMFIVINGYSVNKALVILLLCIVKCIEAISDVYYGILQKNSRLYIAGKSMTYKSLISILGFIVIDLFTKNLLISCLYLLIISICFLLIYDIYNTKRIKKLINDFQKVNIIGLLKASSYTFMFTLTVTVILNLPRYFIDFFLNDSDQAIYGIISMPATFVMLFSQFILQPSLVSLTNHYKRREKIEFNKIVLTISSIILGSMLIILPIAYFLGIPVLEIIYNVELSSYRIYLLLIILGSAFYAVSNVFLNALIVIQCNKEQLWIQILLLALSGVSCFLLISNYGIVGGMISYFVIMFMQFSLYLLLYFFKSRNVFRLKTDKL